MTVWTLAAARMLVMLVTVVGGCLPLGMMREGVLYVDGGDFGLYLWDSGVEWDSERPLSLDYWTVAPDGALRMRGADHEG